MNNSITFLKEIFKNEDVIVLSLSGGPDSMCLLSLLMSEKNEKNLKIIAVHVNHNVRKESDEEEKFVKEYCENNDILFELLKIKSYKDNFHNDARVQRYNFLKEIMKKYNANYLLTAHHGDDLMETILMRLQRGSNIPGYGAFKLIKQEDNYKVLRPLIYTTKKEILDYNNKMKIPYVIDKTNYEDDFTRNRYRNHILPILKKENENIHLKYLKFSNEIYEYDEFLKEYIDSLNVINSNIINLKIFIVQKEFIKRKIIEILISNIQKDNELYITDNNVLEILKLINSKNGKGNIDLPNGYIGIKEKHKFYIMKRG